MQTKFSLFRERLAEACRIRNMTESKVCASIGLSGRLAVNPSVFGPGALDLHRVCQMADVLDVSLDWLMGRSNVMSVIEDVKHSKPPS